MPLQAADGTFNVRVLDGLSLVNLQAADGSYNVVQVSGSSFTGLHHPCGAYNVFLATTTQGYTAPCGAMNVSQIGALKEGTVKVTVLSGTLA